MSVIVGERSETEVATDPTTGLDRLLFLCFFLSGASGLIYEVVWLRWLVHLFGATTLAVSTVLAAFMGGLALGSWAAGRSAPRVTRPLWVYGLLELAIGAYAFLLPHLLEGVVPVLRALGATETSSFARLSLARFALAVVLLTVPTACMGATLPILAQFAARRLESLGSRVGRLYAVNTTGAVLGTGAAGFVLLPTVGVSRTNHIAVALNLAVGLTALWVGRRITMTAAPLAGPPATPRPSADSGPLPAIDGTPDRLRLVAFTALLTAALSGALAMAYEVAWTRALALVLGSSVYAFTVMLTTFLVGLAVGSYLLARRVDRLAEPGLTLGLVQLGIAAAAFGGLLAIQELPYVFLRLFALSGGRHTLLLALEFVITGATIFVPALLAGAVFPLCIRLTGVAGGWAGRTVGNLYTLNTVGAIAGSFVGGFVLLPAVGIRGTLLLAILLNIACAFLLLIALPTRRRRVALPIAAALPALALATPAMAPDWDALLMTSGVAINAQQTQRLSREELQVRRTRMELLWYEEGLTTTVSVEKQPGGNISLRVNGKADASARADAPSSGDMPTQVLSAHIPLLFHPNPQDVLVLGLGSGVSVGSALRHPIRSITVVELERAVVTASHFFDPVNFRPLEDPRTRLVVNDGRNFLLLAKSRFDVISSEPSNPWITGAASLFTRDFFQVAKERLRPGGIFGQWVQLYGMTPELLRSLFASFNTVFPHVAAFQTLRADTVLVGSATPLRLDFADIARRSAAPRVAEDLRRVGIGDVADLFARLALDTEDLPRFTAGAPLNTDDNARVEFTAPRTLYVDSTMENEQRLADAFRGGGTVLTQLARGAPPGFIAQLGQRLLERERHQQAYAIVAPALRATSQADLLQVAGRAAAGLGEVAEAERHWQTGLEQEPTHTGILLDRAAHLEERGELRQALALVRRAAAGGRSEAALREGTLLYRLGDYREAETLLSRLRPDVPEAALSLGLTRLALGDANGAEQLLRDALRIRDDSQTRAGLAAALDRLSRRAEARQERRRAVELDESLGAQLRARGQLRAKVGHLRWAEHDLRHARDLMPAHLDVHAERARLLERMGDRRRAIEAWEEVFRRFPSHTPALVEIASLWEAQGDRGRAGDALQRYIAAEPNATLRRQAEVTLRRLSPATP